MGTSHRLLAGLAAGAAGTTALNLVTHLDMVVRGRPASSTPEETVQRTEELAGVRLATDESVEQNRRSGLGALLGTAAGLGTGVVYGLARPALGRLPLVLRGAVAGALANAGSTVPMTALGVTDPRRWSAGSWASDLVPHLAYGLVTAAVWEMAAHGRGGQLPSRSPTSRTRRSARTITSSCAGL